MIDTKVEGKGQRQCSDKYKSLVPRLTQKSIVIDTKVMGTKVKGDASMLGIPVLVVT